MAILAHVDGTSSRNGVSGRRPFTPSDEQAACLDALEHGNTHLLFEARAGSGKSSTAREGAWRLGNRRSVYCCYNKHIASEFQANLPRTCRAATMHSLGLEMVRAASGGQVLIEGDKVRRIVEAYFPEKYQWGERSAACSLASLCKNLQVDPLDLKQLRALAVAFEVVVPRMSESDVFGIIPQVLDDCKARIDLIDFDDMIWLPVALKLQPAMSPDILFVDEAQDLNPCQHALVDVLCPDGRTIVIGDRFQSIYAFRGADAQSIQRLEFGLAETGLGLETHPMTTTRRCPKRHVSLAQRLVPDLRWLDAAEDGEISCADKDSWMDHVLPGDMVVSRTNAPLVSACYQLIGEGIPATVRGRDIGKGLVTLIARLRARDVTGLLKAIEAHRNEERRRIIDSGISNAAAMLTTMNDRCDCLATIAAPCATIEEVKRQAEEMFSDSDEKRTVVLSSIHRSKGLERDHVAILRPDLLPGPWAESDEDLQQECNLAYVAVTRARKRLTFVGALPPIFDA